MSTPPRFAIGIDLGTTNCAMAYVDLEADGAKSRAVSLRQYQTLGRIGESPTLPSFLYLPSKDDAAAAGQNGWIAGALARAKTAEIPGRVVHSAKSWLCHHAVDRQAPFLPWRSADLEVEERISPLHASSLLLASLRAAWDAQFPEHPFVTQDITVTVPASFDPVAQNLTLEAARAAGFPETVRLLEEPQAAFYHWLENHSLGSSHEDHVLVVDIGGGTSDFSIFHVREGTHGTSPQIKRIAVSDHLLLGGDNIDLAVAHHLSQRIGKELAPAQFGQLVAAARDLKEHCLSTTGAKDQVFSVSVGSRGSSLFAGSLKAEIERHEVESILYEGFFPECDASDRPEESQSALREWALPYASDSAITRYLAAFLSGQPRIDRILFNGGSLYPAALRMRIQGIVAKWQSGHVPQVLENADPDLAVARGAAAFGAIVQRRASRIEAGASRTLFLEVLSPAEKQGAPLRRKLLCILPKGAPEGTVCEADPGLVLRVNRPVQFVALYTSRPDKTRAGQLIDRTGPGFHELPALETIPQLDSNTKNVEQVPVRLEASLNELGMLHIACVSKDPGIKQSWPLAFNLRPVSSGARAEATLEGAPAESASGDPVVQQASRFVVSQFSGESSRREKITGNTLFKGLEKITGQPKSEWTARFIRALWEPLSEQAENSRRSIDHEESWLILAGYLLRPGFGVAGDEERVSALWRIQRGRTAPKRVELQRYILWRRVAGGLSREQQEELISPHRDELVQSTKASAELVRMAGALEHLPTEMKEELARAFAIHVRTLAEEGKHCAPWLHALGLILNRTPFHSEPGTVPRAELVEEIYDMLKVLDWSDPKLVEMHSLFLRAGRLTNNPAVDLPRSLRGRIASRLERAGVPQNRVNRLTEFVPVASSEGAGIFGESLPAGLLLAGNS
jgi:molecular chaperone DnaK (HSP70)